MLSIYGASKFARRELWTHLQAEWPEFYWTARWSNLYAPAIPDEPEFCKIGWIHDLEDIAYADVLLLYAEPDDRLRGALVEAGMAIALGKHVVLVGDHPDFGSWKFHPLVHQVQDLEQARVLLSCMAFEPL